MPTKTQAKTAIDSAVVIAKAEIDALPVGVNIKDGAISFGPVHIDFLLDAEGVEATGDSWLTFIEAYLEGLGRKNSVFRSGRREGEVERFIFIRSTVTSYRIINI